MSPLRRHAAGAAALLIAAALYGVARLPALPADERAQLAARFRFETVELPALEDRPARRQRPVHPSLERISAWINILGAAVALNDLDGDGLDNDVCLVDPRYDEVIVAPAPGLGAASARYEPFVLDPGPLPYDRATTAPMGCVPADCNEDGLLDVVVYYWGRTPIAFLRRADTAGRPPSRACFAAVEIAPTGERWHSNALTVADLDGDGHDDLVVGNYFRDEARILDAGDDAPQQMQDSMSRAFNGGRNRILRWTGATAGAAPGVSYEQVEGVMPEIVARGWALAVGAADLDGDLLPEIYFAHDFGPDRLLHNRSTPGRLRFAVLEGRKRLSTPTSKVLGHDSFKGMGVDFADVNGDGRLDLFVSNIADEYALEESHFLFVSTGETALVHEGVAPYDDLGERLGVSRSGWGWDTRFGDFDADGTVEMLQATGFLAGEIDRWPELHELAMGNDQLLRHPGVWPRFQPGDRLSASDPNPFYVRAASGRYHDLSTDVGLGGHLITRAIATADVDGDGDLDLAIANQWAPSTLHLNRSPAGHASLVLRLRERAGTPGRTRAAIGAEAIVTHPDGRRLVAQVDGGNGHSGARSHALHFGLGPADPDVPVAVTLRWRTPGGVATRDLALRPGTHEIVLDDPEARP